MRRHRLQTFRSEYGIAGHGKESLRRARAADYPILAAKTNNMRRARFILVKMRARFAPASQNDYSSGEHFSTLTLEDQTS